MIFKQLSISFLALSILLFSEQTLSQKVISISGTVKSKSGIIFKDYVVTYSGANNAAFKDSDVDSTGHYSLSSITSGLSIFTISKGRNLDRYYQFGNLSLPWGVWTTNVKLDNNNAALNFILPDPVEIEFKIRNADGTVPANWYANPNTDVDYYICDTPSTQIVAGGSDASVCYDFAYLHRAPFPASGNLKLGFWPADDTLTMRLLNNYGRTYILCCAALCYAILCDSIFVLHAALHFAIYFFRKTYHCTLTAPNIFLPPSLPTYLSRWR